MGQPRKKPDKKTKGKQGQKTLHRDNKLSTDAGHDITTIVNKPLQSLLENEEARAIFEELSENHRIFFVAWLTNGYNATKAYMVMKPECKYDTARAEGTRLFSYPSLVSIRRFHKMDVESIINRCNEVELELIDHHDPDIRLKAAKQLRDYYSKYLQKTAGDDDSGEKTQNIQNNFFLNDNQMNAIKGILNG
jgi:hypothetical protein